MDTIKQKVISIPVEGRDAINVRRMAWKPALDTAAKLATHVKDFAPLLNMDTPDKTAAIRLLIDKATEVVTSSRDITTALIKNSTTLTADEVDNLDMLVATEVLNAALEVNFGDELKNSLLGIGKTLAALFPSKNKTNAGANSTPTSSTPATAPTT